MVNTLTELASKTRNPVLALPMAQKIKRLPRPARELMAEILSDLAKEANLKAEESWQRRKGPMASYWRSVCTYSRHISRALRAIEKVKP